jgi:hypothetical protein
MRRQTAGLTFLALLVAAFAAAQTAPPNATARVSAGPVVGYSLLERKDTSLTHGALRDEVTLGRSWLLGGVVDVRVTRHDTLAVEFLYGPFHNDMDRSCVWQVSTSPQVCDPAVLMETTHATHFGVQYARIFGRGHWRPYAGAGIGVKRYAFRDESFGPSTTSAVFSVAGGLEAAARMPIRIEIKAMFVRNNPLLHQLDQREQFELQTRFVILVF